MGDRPELICHDCGYTWTPRGKDYSARCPNCGVPLGDEQFALERAKEHERQLAARRATRGCIIISTCLVVPLGACALFGMLGRAFLPDEQPTKKTASTKTAVAREPAPLKPGPTLDELIRERPPPILAEAPKHRSVETPVPSAGVESKVPPPKIEHAKPAQPTHEMRTWSSAAGAFQVEAAFVSSGAGKVKLRKADGEIITVDLNKLSDTDRAYVHGLH